MRATWISTISSKTISSPPLKDAMLLLPLVTWNSHHLQAMDYMIYIKIFSFQLINAFCLMCHIKPISNPYLGHIWVTPSSPNWTLDFEPAFSQRFYFPLSPRSIFPTRQRFPLPNHVTSGSHEPTILFSHWSAVSHPKTRDFRFKPRDFR